MDDFKTKYGPWALVAGASEGLGAAFAEELAKRGLNLILIARRLEKLEALSDKLRSRYPIEIRCHSLDLSELSQIKHFVPRIEVNIGLLVYNAAYAPIGYFENISEDDLIKIVDVNIKAPVLLTKLLLTPMIERKKGGIVLMSSLAGTQGSPKIATYAASKAFNAIFAEGIWSELKGKGIDVIASCAGAIMTPGYESAQNAKGAPGTMNADRVAKKTMDALGKGPTTIPGFTNKVARFFMGRLLPRKSAISLMAHQTKNLS